jgi:hypothetical protein
LEASVRQILLGVALTTTVAVSGAASLSAHHASSTFATGKEIVLKGIVTEWVWTNPHCYLRFDAKDETGAVRNWAVETQNPVTMVRQGWSRRSFKVGDEVTVRLEPAKNGAPVGRILNVLLPTGETLVAVGPRTPAPPGR